uniref:Uncharacterized protein n=1 Tax=Aegilops tauschii subsp. strangulata TaxID=200361 RepID=A0A453ET15_AEGTS
SLLHYFIFYPIPNQSFLLRFRSAGPLRLFSSMEVDHRDHTLQPDELDELDGQVLRPDHHDSAENNKVDPCRSVFLFFLSDCYSAGT